MLQILGNRLIEISTVGQCHIIKAYVLSHKTDPYSTPTWIQMNINLSIITPPTAGPV